MIQIGSYITKDLLKLLGVSNDQWKKRKSEYLEHMKLYFDYETFPKGTSQVYNIKEIYAEWEPLPSKKDKKNILSYYSQETENIIKKDKFTTGSQLARDIRKLDNFSFTHKEGTSANYCRTVLKSEYEIVEREWRHIDLDNGVYTPLTTEQLKFLKECLKRMGSEAVIEQEIDYINDKENGVITEAELKERLWSLKLKTYEDCIAEFEAKYDFRPRKVPGWNKQLF